MTSSITNCFNHPNFDLNVIVHDISPYLTEPEKGNFLNAISNLYQPPNEPVIRRIYREMTEQRIQKITNPLRATHALMTAVKDSNLYLLHRLVHSLFHFTTGYKAGHAFIGLAKQGDLAGMEIILQSPKKGEVAPHHYSRALAAAAKTGQIRVIQRLSEPDLVGQSIDDVSNAIGMAPESKNWLTVINMLIDKVPQNERRETFTAAAITAARMGNTRCLKYLANTNLLLPEDFDQAFSKANDVSVDYFLDPNQNIPISKKVLLNRLDQAQKVDDWRVVARILSSKQAISQIRLPELTYMSDKKKFFEILDKHIHKYAEKMELHKDDSVLSYGHILDQASDFGRIRTIKAFVERPSFINQIVVNEFLETTYLIGTERLTDCLITCREAGKEELAEQIEAIINERNRCPNKARYLLRTEILPRLF